MFGFWTEIRHRTAVRVSEGVTLPRLRSTSDEHTGIDPAGCLSSVGAQMPRVMVRP
jgi:hypothetical protein